MTKSTEVPCCCSVQRNAADNFRNHLLDIMNEASREGLDSETMAGILTFAAHAVAAQSMEPKKRKLG